MRARLSTYFSLRQAYCHTSRAQLQIAPKGSNSYVQQGTLFEERVLSKLTNYKMELERVGGRNDRGIDLIGHWKLNKEYSVIIQCKNTINKLEIKWLRELEGVLINQEKDAIGMLVTNNTFSKEMITSLFNSKMPLCLVTLEDGEDKLRMKCFFVNDKVNMLLGNQLIVTNLYNNNQLGDQVLLVYKQKRLDSN